jgi:hypothetical protein
MIKKALIRLVLTASMALGLGMVSSQAHAQMRGQILAQGTSVIGTVSGAPYVVTSPAAGGACRFVRLNTSGSGLQDNWIVSGTQGADIILFAQSSLSFCNYTVTPLVTNGYRVTINGWYGEDTLQRGPLADLFGDTEADTLMNGPYTSGSQLAFLGAHGADRFYVSNLNLPRLLGHDGGNLFCTPPNFWSQEVRGMEVWWDRYCGNAIVKSGLDQLDCKACGY